MTIFIEDIELIRKGTIWINENDGDNQFLTSSELLSSGKKVHYIAAVESVGKIHLETYCSYADFLRLQSLAKQAKPVTLNYFGRVMSVKFDSSQSAVQWEGTRKFNQNPSYIMDFVNIYLEEL